eukprot:75939_1
MEQVLKVHETFRPLLLSKILTETLTEITAHRKDRDDAQMIRLQTALDILNSNIDLPAYPEQTHQSLVSQIMKQMNKITKTLKKQLIKIPNTCTKHTIQQTEKIQKTEKLQITEHVHSDIQNTVELSTTKECTIPSLVSGWLRTIANDTKYNKYEYNDIAAIISLYFEQGYAQYFNEKK